MPRVLDHSRGTRESLVQYPGPRLHCFLFPVRWTLQGTLCQCQKVEKELDQPPLHRQSSFESLKEYVARFHGEALLIPKLEHAVAVAALIQGTRDVSLKRALILDEPENLTDLITRAHRYTHCNEVLLSIRDHDDPRGQDKARKASREPERRENATARRRDDFDSRSRDKRPRAPERYTHLNLTPSQVLMEIRGKEYLR